MLSENKYRIWDKERKQFQYLTSREGLNSSIIRMIEENGQQKFTGLKDIKGIEIYEGDFIREDIEIEGEENQDPTGFVKYDEKAEEYYVFDGSEESGFFLNEYIDMVEVIGNIYENKELLKTMSFPREEVKPIELKFRVWDGNQMIYVTKKSGFRLIFEGSNWELEFKGQLHCSSNKGTCNLMPFSGAIDIQGKEIYEGDLIKNAINENDYKKKYPKEYKEYGFYIGDFLGLSTYDNSSSSWAIDNPKYSNFEMVHHFFAEIEMSLVEVIGNIYENNSLYEKLLEM